MSSLSLLHLPQIHITEEVEAFVAEATLTCTYVPSCCVSLGDEGQRPVGCSYSRFHHTGIWECAMC